ncbi:hypothetical protein KA525_03215 [Candidatus Woesebacteria bacterium]|nr:hypothetical protein [Candidatus Woesebacteria bacterium]
MRNFKRNLKITLGVLVPSLFFASALFQSCGRSEVAPTTIGVPIALIDSSGGTNLQLAGSTSGVPVASFVMALAGCSSGLSASSTASQSVINVYLGDQSCLAKLTSFVDNGLTYSATGGTDFTTFLAGDTAAFKSTTTPDFAYLTVVKQLTSSGILAGDYVSYNVVFNNKGTNNASTLTLGTPISLYVAQTSSPNFKINAAGDASLVSIDATGKGYFKFKLTCNLTMSAGGAGHTTSLSFCPSVTGSTVGGYGVDIYAASNTDSSSALLSYAIIEDTNGTGNLSMADARAAFSNAGIVKTAVNFATDYAGTSPTSGVVGFNTPVSGIVGPGTVSTKPKMFLLLIAKNPLSPTTATTASFQYFPITVSAVTP